MTDRELLELAAKAAGLSLSHCDDSVWDDERADYVGWNPLTDDGDAFRLAVKLWATIGQASIDDGHHWFITVAHDDIDGEIWEPIEDDPCAATRRSIVRAAAEIGKQELKAEDA